MRYLVAPSAYKGSFTPSQIARAISDGVLRAHPDSSITLAPIADGGDGTIEALQIATGGTVHTVPVSGPTGEPVTANWLVVAADKIPPDDDDFSFLVGEESLQKEPKDLAVVELAAACGLAYIAPDRLAPLDATTIGAGQVIAHCIKQGFDDLVLAVGGSASTDGGIGILSALGATFYNRAGEPLTPNGRFLNEIATADLSKLSSIKIRLRVATDVINPLLGENGAARIFGPQKGASEADVESLETGLSNYADVLEKTAGQIARGLPGAGAAGGVPFGLAVALNAEIIPGFRWLTTMIDLQSKLRNADVVISAEGSLDRQSVSGKATGELSRMCKEQNKIFWVVAGRVEEGVDWKQYGIDRVIACAAPQGTFASLADVTAATAQLCV